MFAKIYTRLYGVVSSCRYGVPVMGQFWPCGYTPNRSLFYPLAGMVLYPLAGMVLYPLAGMVLYPLAGMVLYPLAGMVLYPLAGMVLYPLAGMVLYPLAGMVLYPLAGSHVSNDLPTQSLFGDQDCYVFPGGGVPVRIIVSFLRALIATSAAVGILAGVDGRVSFL